MDAIKTAEEFFSTPDASVKPFEIPEWNRTVHLRDLRGTDLETIIGLRRDGKPILAYMLKASVVKPDGSDLFATTSDAERALKKPAKVIERIVTEINERNGMDDDVSENFTTDQSSASDTA